MLIASELLLRGLQRLTVKLRLTEGLLGLLTALGADAPEISSAIAALIAGSADVGRGVVLGSNIFNLAMLLGLSAVVSGQVRARRQSLVFNGTMALLMLLVVAALLLDFLATFPAMILLVVLFIPYVVLLSVRPRQMVHLPLPYKIRHFLLWVVSELHHQKKEEGEDEQNGRAGTKESWLPVLFVPFSLAVIVMASIWLVKAALALSTAWHLPHALVGAVFLAGLTGLPNVYAAVRLALRNRGVVVVSETLNSNTINLVVGLALPVLLLGMGGAASHVSLELGWLLGMTGLGLLLLLPAKGMMRISGSLMILLYLLFVVAHVLWPHV